MDSNACDATTIGASEWCFDKGAFDHQKLSSHHDGHSGNIALAAAETSWSLDIACQQCRQTFSQKPSAFVYDTTAITDPISDFKAYLWVRHDKRDAFLADLRGLHPARADTVTANLERLSREKEEFAKYGPKRRLLVSFEGWREKWITGRLGPDDQQPTARYDHRQSGASTAPLTLFTNLHDRQAAWWERSGITPATASPPKAPIDLCFNGHYKAGVMYFERKGDDKSFNGVTLEGLAQNFPDQRIPVEDLLSAIPEKIKSNPLAQRCGENTLRYFHIPANNMSWVEVRPQSWLKITRLTTCTGGHVSILRGNQATSQGFQGCRGHVPTRTAAPP